MKFLIIVPFIQGSLFYLDLDQTELMLKIEKKNISRK